MKSNQIKSREYYSNLILESNAKKKIIVAGPGTGKTYIFEELLKRTNVKNNLVLTFIRRLIEDMKKELTEYADVKTFHEFAISLFYECNISKYDIDSNLGWRILIEEYKDQDELEYILNKSVEDIKLVELIDNEFIEHHINNINILNSYNNKDDISEEHKSILKSNLNDDFADILISFFPDDPEIIENEIDEPTILLTSFQGCKGLSAGFVFILGAVEGNIPQINQDGQYSNIFIDCCKFTVAMTRTRKCCYILTNQWETFPNSPEFLPSIFLSFIPNEYLINLGLLKAKDIN